MNSDSGRGTVVLENMNDVRARASRLKSSDEQLRQLEYDVTQEECDFL
jgi:hypothetical protein